MSDLTARLMEVVARIRAEQDARLGVPPPAPPVAAPAPAAPVRLEPSELAPAPERPTAPVDPASFGPVLVAHGQAVEFRVPGGAEKLYLVADEAMADVLAEEGIPRGRCWTPEEIRMVTALSVASRQAVAIAKVRFDGTVEEVLSAPPPAPDPAPLRDREQQDCLPGLSDA